MPFDRTVSTTSNFFEQVRYCINENNVNSGLICRSVLLPPEVFETSSSKLKWATTCRTRRVTKIFKVLL